MIRKLEEGRSLTSVAEDFGISKSVISRSWKAFQTIGTDVRKVDGSLPRKMISVKDLSNVLHAKRPRYHSASAIAQQLYIPTGRQVSQFIVVRRLHKRRLFACHPEHYIPLKVSHRQQCLEWYMEHKKNLDIS
ncbi:transposable element Tcb2 transposase [Trichonephila clavipes]|nr:transposable element Tcb2 transposase [Trichonephila clavipes]